MKKLTLILLAINIYSASAQIIADNDKEKNLALNSAVVRTFDQRYEGVKGSPYLFDKWINGRIILRTGMETGGPLKYDVYEDQVAVVLTSGDSIILLPRSVDTFTLLDVLGEEITFKYIGVNYIDAIDQSDFGFYQVLFIGKHRLVSKKRITLKKADYEGAYSSGKKYDEFVAKNDDLYFWQADDSLFKIKLNKSSIINYFEEMSIDIEPFVKSNKLKFKEPSELVKLLQYLENR